MEALAQLSSPADVAAAVTDLLSPSELHAVAERWEIVRLLGQGLSQRAVRDAVGCSIATVTRGAAQMRSGGKGFDLLLRVGAAQADLTEDP